MDRKDLMQSLERFRKGLLQMGILIVVLGAAIFPFSKTLLWHLHLPLGQDLVALAIPEVFLGLLKLTLFASLFLAVPLLFYRIWESFSPIFRGRGMESGYPVIIAAIFLFYLGAGFCYFVTLPFGIRFLLGYQSTQIQPMITVGKYITFCSIFVFAFGLTFELPLVLALLSYVNLVKSSFLTRNRRYAILLIAVVAAAVTPTPDVFNMTLMGGPLYVLFEIGVVLVKLIERKRVVSEALSGKGSMDP